ncbi:MAG: hypothetical protein AB7F31_00095 [Parachlamydiales bacterium]
MPEQGEKRRSWLERLPPAAQTAYHDLCLTAKEIGPFWERVTERARQSWHTVFSDAKEAGPGSFPDTVHKITAKAHEGAGKGKEWAKQHIEKAAPKIKESCKLVREDARELEGKAKVATHKAMDGIEKCCHKASDKVKELVGSKSGGKSE